MRRNTNKKKSNDIVKVLSSFARSTNIEIDYKDTSKLNSIFLTQKFEQGLLELLNSIIDTESNHRVRVLSGSPGLGKSTFSLLASNLVSKSNTRIVKRIIESNENKKKNELSDLYSGFQKAKANKLLPVFLNGYMGNIEDAFIEKLKKAMSSVGLEKEFSSLVKEVSKNQVAIIKKWKTSFPDIYEKYTLLVESEGEEISAFEKSLKKGSSNARETFEYIYSEITGGASSSTNVKSDVIGLFRKCSKVLCENGFGGIYVVYDEFGKYLEKGIHNPSLLNVQFLQDFAEYCDRSGKEQCHLVLITHLSVSQYASKLPVNIQKEWAKIEGRFQESSFFDKNTNHYKMISMVFESSLSDFSPKLGRKWNKFVKDIAKRFSSNDIGLENMFNSKDSLKTIERCYPLHPVTLALLPLVSQKVAQNERTIYTFLTRDEDYSLSRFIEDELLEDDLSILSFSKLYDYFSPLVAKDTGIGGNYKIQLMYEEACNKIDRNNKLGKEMVALVSLLSIVKDNTFSPISENFIIHCFLDSYKEKEIKNEIKNLVNKKVLLLNKAKNQFELVEGSAIDIDEEIKKLKKKKLTSKELVKILKNYVKPSYIIPKKYNFEHKTTRFYRSEVISFEDLHHLDCDLKPNYGREDGVVYYVIPFSRDELDQARSFIKQKKNECTAFILPNTFIECKADLEELNAVNALFANKEVISSGPLVKKELERHKEILIESIENIVKPLLGKTFLQVKGYYPKLGMNSTLKHTSELNRFLGNVFELEYKHSVDFNSEYTNRNKITGNIALARKIAIDAIINNRNKTNFGLDGNGPEVAIIKALKQVSSMKIKGEKVTFPKNSSLSIGLEAYKSIISKNGGASSEELIKTFLAPPFGIRKAIIPLLSAVWDLSLDSPVNHYYDGKFVTKVDGDHYDMLLKQPKICKIQYTAISAVKRSFISKIANVFGADNINEVQSLLTVFYNWRRTIPESTKLSDTLSKTQKKFLIHIDSAQEPAKLIFELIPSTYGLSEVTEDTSKASVEKAIKSLKQDVDSIYVTYPGLVKELNYQLVESLQFLQEKCLSEKPFEYSKGMNLAKIYQATLNRFSDNIKNYPFSSKTSKFLGRVKGFDFNKHPQYFIETVADSLTNSNPRNWDVKGKAMFEFALNQAVNEVETVVEYLSTDIGGESAIAFINKDTGERDFLRLGITTNLNKKLEAKASVVKDVISDLSEKERYNLLVNLLRTNENKTKANVDVQI